jgi:hypothetical protein
MLLTWFVDVDMTVHHTRHKDQVPHILNPKAGAFKQLRLRRCVSSRKCANSRVPGHGKKERGVSCTGSWSNDAAELYNK